MPLERDHLVLLLAGALVGAGLAAVLPGLEAPDRRHDTRPEAPVVEHVRVRGIAHVGAGDAETALPLLPLEADADGALLGRTNVGDLAGATDPVVDWHRSCLPGGEAALPDPANGSEPLRYLDPGRVAVQDPYDGADPWYAPRHGEPVHAADLPAGRPAYAAWSAGPNVSADDPILVLLEVNASHRTAAHDPFTEDGVVAFAARAPPACRLAAVAPDVPPDDGAGVRRVVEDHPRLAWPPEPEVAVDPTNGDAWDPAVVVRDLLVNPVRPPPPTAS